MTIEVIISTVIVLALAVTAAIRGRASWFLIGVLGGTLMVQNYNKMFGEQSSAPLDECCCSTVVYEIEVDSTPKDTVFVLNKE